jgi:translation initiation factor IF-2
MKTLTELSGALIRMAASAVAEVKRSVPEEETPAAPAAVEAAPEVKAVEAAAPEAAAPDAAPAEGAVPVAAAPEAAPVVAKAPEAKKEPVVVPESDALKAALDEAVAKATGLSGDRLARLRDAVKAVGKRSADVRLVRVFGVEEKVEGAATLGEFQYVVDLSPANMKQVMTLPEKGRGGKGGRPGGGGAGGAKPNAAAGNSGSFSMDSVMQDRKAEGGRFGGGRSGAKRPGGAGGRPAGGRGRPPGGGRGP